MYGIQHKTANTNLKLRESSDAVWKRKKAEWDNCNPFRLHFTRITSYYIYFRGKLLMRRQLKSVWKYMLIQCFDSFKELYCYLGISVITVLLYFQWIVYKCGFAAISTIQNRIGWETVHKWIKPVVNCAATKRFKRKFENICRYIKRNAVMLLHVRSPKVWLHIYVRTASLHPPK